MTLTDEQARKVIDVLNEVLDGLTEIDRRLVHLMRKSDRLADERREIYRRAGFAIPPRSARGIGR